MCRSWTDRVLAGLLFLLAASPASAGQLGALLSPGPLARAHRQLEGAQCQQCHEAGRKVSASRCLTCHAPVAERIAARKGVHRQATECVSCHVEHAGVDGDLRHLNTRTFNHAVEAGYPLTGQHARVAASCASCHKGRSFLEATTSCASCHADPHRGSLGAECTTCHRVASPFRNARTAFDHSGARFQLTGAHREVACESCHRSGTFRGVAFASCTSCHREPHAGRLGAACTSCHTTVTWKTQTVQHARTGFPLRGAHASVRCESCHTSRRMTDPLNGERCSSCHVNVHRDSIRDDCGACHSETTFKGGTFDHGARTGFALTGKHATLACEACHARVAPRAGPAITAAAARPVRVPPAEMQVDFSGARPECVACHLDKDPHKGEFGRACDACHTTATFSVQAFRHPGDQAFFGGQHQPLACVKCHAADAADRPAHAAAPARTCVACHADTHLGQLGSTCDSCHAVDGSRFKAVAFSHERTMLPLSGKHAAVECVKCHTTQTGAFPARTGTAVRYTPIDVTCVSCHRDPHLGQVSQSCDTCHSSASFEVATFVHQGLEDFFAGIHAKYACHDCHKPERRVYPAGEGLAVRFAVGRSCAACHPQF